MCFMHNLNYNIFFSRGLTLLVGGEGWIVGLLWAPINLHARMGPPLETAIG